MIKMTFGLSQSSYWLILYVIFDTLFDFLFLVTINLNTHGSQSSCRCMYFSVMYTNASTHKKSNSSNMTSLGFLHPKLFFSGVQYQNYFLHDLVHLRKSNLAIQCVGLVFFTKMFKFPLSWILHLPKIKTEKFAILLSV